MMHFRLLLYSVLLTEIEAIKWQAIKAYFHKFCPNRLQQANMEDDEQTMSVYSFKYIYKWLINLQFYF